MTREAEHREWNEAHGLHAGDGLSLVCPVCAVVHEETITKNPNEPDFYHHVHQCTACGVRFDLFVRCRADGRAMMLLDDGNDHEAKYTQEQIVDLQVRAMRSIAEGIRMSLSTYADAVEKSAEIQARLATKPAGEIRDAFELIIRRAYAVIESAEKSARAQTQDGPQTETKEPS